MSSLTQPPLIPAVCCDRKADCSARWAGTETSGRNREMEADITIRLGYIVIEFCPPPKLRRKASDPLHSRAPFEKLWRQRRISGLTEIACSRILPCNRVIWYTRVFAYERFSQNCTECRQWQNQGCLTYDGMHDASKPS